MSAWHADVAVVEDEQHTFIHTAQMIAGQWRSRTWRIRYDEWLHEVIVHGPKRRPAGITRLVEAAVARLTPQ